MNTPERGDPLIEEVEEMRRRLFADCDNDLGKLFAYLRESEKEFAGRMIGGQEPQPEEKSAA